MITLKGLHIVKTAMAVSHYDSTNVPNAHNLSRAQLNGKILNNIRTKAEANPVSKTRAALSGGAVLGSAGAALGAVSGGLRGAGVVGGIGTGLGALYGLAQRSRAINHINTAKKDLQGFTNDPTYRGFLRGTARGRAFIAS